MKIVLLGEASIADWISAISQLLFLILFVMIFLGVNQRFQVFIWRGDIRQKLMLIERMASESLAMTKEFIVKNRGRNVDELLRKVADFFVIEPVTIEPIDVIKRLENLFNARRIRFKGLLQEAMPDSDEYVRSRAESASEIVGVLSYIVKVIKHILILEEKTKNWLLIMQLQLSMPLIMREVETLRRATEYFIKGVPIGDGAGPLVAHMLAGHNARWSQIEEDTVYSVADVEGREVYIVKAKGPGSSVGRPGLAVEKLIERLVSEGKRPSLLITVDAALKLESEETGEVAEGVGAAIGDPGPEKIRLERIAAKYEIPLRAIVIKMSHEEAITVMNRKIYEASLKAVEQVRALIKSQTKTGDVVVVAGIGNSMGIA